MKIKNNNNIHELVSDELVVPPGQLIAENVYPTDYEKKYFLSYTNGVIVLDQAKINSDIVNKKQSLVNSVKNIIDEVSKINPEMNKYSNLEKDSFDQVYDEASRVNSGTLPANQASGLIIELTEILGVAPTDAQITTHANLIISKRSPMFLAVRKLAGRRKKIETEIDALVNIESLDIYKDSLRSKFADFGII